MLEMTDREKYIYDIQGYLVVKDFLTPEEVDRLNAAFDANRDKIKNPDLIHPGQVLTIPSA